MILSSEKYRLDLKWEAIEYKDNVCVFKGAYFSGPVLAVSEMVESNSNIELDFYTQYFIIVNNVYIGKLSWGEVKYVSDKILLQDCTITHKSEINKVPQLKNNDMLIIDCRNHERETHDFYPNYKTYVVNEDTQVYDYAS